MNQEAKRWTSRALRHLPKRADGLKPHRTYAYTFRALVETVVSRFGRRPALSLWRDEGSRLTYEQLGIAVRRCAMYLLAQGWRKGDRFLILGSSCPAWMVAYLALTTVGMVAVPVLPEFSAPDIRHIIASSEAKGVFVSPAYYGKCVGPESEGLAFFRLDDLFALPSSLLDGTEATFRTAPGRRMCGFVPGKEDRKRWEASVPEEDDVASLIFTSGTTGSSKGVLLTHRNLVWTADMTPETYFKARPGMRCLSLLPMSHVYEFTVHQLVALLCGLDMVYLGKPPAASVLRAACAEVRPEVMFTVPLLIEKIYRSNVGPVLKNRRLQPWLHWRVSRHFICRAAGRKIVLGLGGKLRFFGIGGAPLDPVVERFLYDAGFPYALGYGLTETSPIISASGPKKRQHRPHFIGRVMPGEAVVVDHPDAHGVGEILVKGPNVCKGYWKRPDLERESFTDGFFRTGDLGVLDHGWLGIRGRCKTMILGSSGENIYPEAIESLINREAYVSESLVVMGDGGLTALIRLDMESYAKAMKLSVDEARGAAAKYLENLRKRVNRDLSASSRIDEVALQEQKFERTPTLKIKRFLYEHRSGKRR